MIPPILLSMDASWIRVDGVVVAGHGVASGRSGDPRFPGGTLAAQIPLFRDRSLDLSPFYPGTINVTIRPRGFTPRKAFRTLRDVDWCEGVPPEDFSFFRCRISIAHGTEEKWEDGLVYYPHPETKPDHFQDPSVLEILAPRLRGICPGAGVSLQLRREELEIK